MKIVKYEPEKKGSILAEALLVLLSGGTVVYPTETAYGLGADFYSPRAYRRIQTIKYRDKKKPLPVIVPDINYASTVVRFSHQASQLAAQNWPGPLTLVLPFLYPDQWPYHMDRYLALRVSSHPVAANLAKAFGRPLISTSANRSGHTPCYAIEDIFKQFSKLREQPDLIIDAGKLPYVLPSTIIKEDEKGIRVLREGSIEVNV